MFRTAILVLCTLALALNAAYASASTTPGPDTFKVDYFSNANTSSAPDATVHLTNPGLAATYAPPSTFLIPIKRSRSAAAVCSLPMVCALSR